MYFYFRLTDSLICEGHHFSFFQKENLKPHSQFFHLIYPFLYFFTVCSLLSSTKPNNQFKTSKKKKKQPHKCFHNEKNISIINKCICNNNGQMSLMQKRTNISSIISTLSIVRQAKTQITLRSVLISISLLKGHRLLRTPPLQSEMQKTAVSTQKGTDQSFWLTTSAVS